MRKRSQVKKIQQIQNAIVHQIFETLELRNQPYF